MLSVLRNSWALLLGVMLLMLGNGLQGTLLGVRGKIEGFSAVEMAYVTSAYYLGFLFGSKFTPDMIRRVGHVRVFAALGSVVSAMLVLYPIAPDWKLWILMRVATGFSFAGVYITSESWLNASVTNDTRGQALSGYMIMQMIGMMLSQALLNFRDPRGFDLFIIASVLVSLAFTPILLSAGRVPSFEKSAAMPLRRLLTVSPLSCVGIFLIGLLISGQFGMAAVWAAEAGLSVRDLSLYVGAIYLGGLVMQYPIGWASDHLDRRRLIVGLAFGGALVTLMASVLPWALLFLIAVAFMSGGATNPLYSLLVAYANDRLESDEMAGASAGLLFIYGIGAIAGPIATGWFMMHFGPEGYFYVMVILFTAVAAYAAWRMTRRRAQVFVRRSFRALSTSATALAVGAAIEKTRHRNDH